MKKLILILSVLFVLPTLSYAAIPLTQEKAVTESVTPAKISKAKKVKQKKERKAVKLYKKLLKKIGVPEGRSSGGLLNGLSFGSAILGLLLLAIGSSAALLSLPLAIAAIVLGIIGMRRGESLKGLGIAGIALGGTLLLLFLLAILIIASWLN